LGLRVTIDIGVWMELKEVEDEEGILDTV